MIKRRHQRNDANCVALYSDCERYRYLLRIIWDTNIPPLMFIMLNPSTATEIENDPTVARCENRARTLGYGGVCVANIFAYRSTDPDNLTQVEDPIGDCNNDIILRQARLATRIVCAWGNHGELLGRGNAVATMLREKTDTPLCHLGLNKKGQGEPKHPLYICSKKELEEW